MTTFSQLVDSVAIETRRPDLRADIATYLNQTIREAHFYPGNGAVVFYRENLKELMLVSAVESGFGWQVPDPALFQGMGVVRYDSIPYRDDLTRYPPEKVPGRGMVGLDRYYYRAGGRWYFSGCGGIGSRVAIAYYEYPRRAKYYAVADRPATYDSDLGWVYSPIFDTTDELRLAARNFTSNWLLERWEDVIAEGVRAKVYKRLADTERARTCFSQYTTLRMGLCTSESSQLGGFG